MSAPTGFRVRKEIRTLSEQEWNDFVDVIKTMYEVRAALTLCLFLYNITVPSPLSSKHVLITWHCGMYRFTVSVVNEISDYKTLWFNFSNLFCIRL